MVKKIHFQDVRTSRRLRRKARGAWILEPMDGYLIGAAILAALWLQWISVTS